MAGPGGGRVAKKVAVHKGGKTFMQTKWVNPNKGTKHKGGHTAHHKLADASHPTSSTPSFLERHSTVRHLLLGSHKEGESVGSQAKRQLRNTALALGAAAMVGSAVGMYARRSGLEHSRRLGEHLARNRS